MLGIGSRWALGARPALGIRSRSALRRGLAHGASQRRRPDELAYQAQALGELDDLIGVGAGELGAQRAPDHALERVDGASSGLRVRRAGEIRDA